MVRKTPVVVAVIAVATASFFAAGGLLTASEAVEAVAAPPAPAIQAGAASEVTLVRSDVSAPLSQIALRAQPRRAPGRARQVPIKTPMNLMSRHIGTPDRDTVVQRNLTPVPLAGKVLAIEGVSDDDNALIDGRVVPPDTNGDVGLRHYVQWVNLAMNIYDKSTGASVLPGGTPIAGNAVFAGMGGICETTNDGDPIVLYDHLADRWVLSQFAIGVDGHQCIAVSTSDDPLGTYNRYDYIITTGGLNDYPKLGVWHDGYYMTQNEFAGGFLFTNASVVAFERDAMLAGDPAPVGVKWNLTCGAECPFSLQPGNLDGPAPPASDPEMIVMAFDDETWGTGVLPDSYRLWEARPDYANVPASTLTTLAPVNTAEFDSEMCGFSLACIPQAAPGESLAPLAQFTMFRAQVREWGEYQSIVVNHTVDASPNNTDIGGVRWAELRNDGSGWVVHQNGTVARNDGAHRWMGSIAMDGIGNIALGYSVSGAAFFPAIRMAYRTPATPLNGMAGEVHLQSGSGVQTGSFNRWGDYSSMSVDPVDDCTFWYTQEYYANTNSFDFKTRIIAFQLPGCGS